MALIDNLISYYKCDENAANTTVADAHGSNTGTASTNTNNLYNAGGLINSAFEFDGSIDKVRITGEDFIGTERAILTVDDRSSTNTVSIYRGGAWIATTGLTISINAWHHIAMVSDSVADTIKIYLDNVLIDTHTSTSYASDISFSGWFYHNGALATDNRERLWDNLDNIMTIGASNLTLNTEVWNGKLDEFAWFSDVLSAQDVSDLYNSGDGLAYPFGATESFTKTGNARILIQDSFTKTGTARIQINDTEQVYDSDARIFIEDIQFTKTGDSSILIQDIQFTKDAESRILIQDSFDKTGNARIFIEDIQFTKQGNSRIAIQDSFEKTGEASIRIPNRFDKTGTARIFIQDIQFTKTGNANILINDKEFTKTGNANIKIENNQFTKTGNCSIAFVNQFTKTGNANIKIIDTFQPVLKSEQQITPKIKSVETFN